ncbi:hypothetical protein O0L34_g12706 [Tuta absoluta]|nr:hypothetical protein O0L34_g12706 [Tuta absoluta]
MKRSRKSPYYINWDGETTSEFGNNVSISMKLLEYLSGRWVPTPLQSVFKFCEFFEKEPYLGRMYEKQLKSLMTNWTCPLPAGGFHFHNLVIHMEDFPFNIPFTWAPVIVKTRSDIEFFATKTREKLIIGTMDFTIIQKPHRIRKE